MLAAGSLHGLQQLQRRCWTLQTAVAASSERHEKRKVNLLSLVHHKKFCLSSSVHWRSCNFSPRHDHDDSHVVVMSQMSMSPSCRGKISHSTHAFILPTVLMEALTSHIPISVMISGCAVLNGKLWLQWSVWRSGCKVQGWARGAHENGSVGSQ